MPMAAAKKRGRGRPKKDFIMPRKSLKLAQDWFDLAQELAGTRKQPAIWMLMEFLAEEAERQGKDRPPFPWETKGAVKSPQQGTAK
jgi:hypothetical protein